ncbi:PREDICTED: transcription termination factor MTERF8, chloroplastic-like [Tarenaya hassleriana]|uniref:transcription termination factor MTERF8, chloroplastic-like n=1 Tax=Tarenaya hassleriana TaxID=28532 RepID=UPI00053C0CBA|nr:PREDICTED: transcription termination factor MTERF8, chloroplastic-like [Tarenaya hassleriana]
METLPNLQGIEKLPGSDRLNGSSCWIKALHSLKFTSLDKIRGRVLSFQSLEINDLKLQFLIAKCPKLLTSEEIDPVIRFLVDELDAKLEPDLVERLFSVADPSFLVGFNQKVRLLIRHGIPKEKISHVLEKVNLTKLLCQRSVEDIERVISFFEPFGGIGIIVRRPAILNFDLDGQLVPRVSFLRNLSGEDDHATGTVLHRLPAILSYSVEHMDSHVEFLKSFAGLTSDQVFKIIHVFPNVISTSKERKLRPRIGFLKQCGLDSLEIFKFLSKAPLFLALSEDNLSQKLGFLVKIGYEHRTKELAHAMGAVTRTSSDNMQRVIGLYLTYGLSLADILAMSKKHPPVLQYTHCSLEEKMGYLIEEMGREVEELLAFPAFLGYKLDSRIKHRYEAKRTIRGENMSLNKLLTVSTERFSKKKDKTESLVHD